MATTVKGSKRTKPRFEISSDKAREQFGGLINRAAGTSGERVVVTRHGLPVVAFVSIEDLEKLEKGEAAE